MSRNLIIVLICHRQKLLGLINIYVRCGGLFPNITLHPLLIYIYIFFYFCNLQSTHVHDIYIYIYACIYMCVSVLIYMYQF
jgi:hypothetical protein